MIIFWARQEVHNQSCWLDWKIHTSDTNWHTISLTYFFSHLELSVLHPFLKRSQAVCDDTKNLNETESKTFYLYQFFSILNPFLFSIPTFSIQNPILFYTNFSRYFFIYQMFLILNPTSLFIPIFFRYRIRNNNFFLKIFKTDSNKDTKFHKTMFQTDKSKIFLIIFLIPNPRLFSISNIFDTESDTFFDTKLFPIPNLILFL